MTVLWIWKGTVIGLTAGLKATEGSLPTALTGSTGLKAHNQLKADATPKQTVEQEFMA